MKRFIHIDNHDFRTVLEIGYECQSFWARESAYLGESDKLSQHVAVNELHRSHIEKDHRCGVLRLTSVV